MWWIYWQKYRMIRLKFAQLFQLANPDWCSVLILISLKTAIKMHPVRKRSNSAFWCFLVGCCYRKTSNNGNEIHKLWPTHKYFYRSWKYDKKKLHICDRYEPAMSNRRALNAIFYVWVSVSHKCEAGVIQLRSETTADVSLPVGRWVMTQLDCMNAEIKQSDRKQQKSSCFTSLHTAEAPSRTDEKNVVKNESRWTQKWMVLPIWNVESKGCWPVAALSSHPAVYSGIAHYPQNICPHLYLLILNIEYCNNNKNRLRHWNWHKNICNL